MFIQIVIGVDEHEGGRRRNVLAKTLAAPDGVLTLAFVYCGERYVYRGVSAVVEAAERERALVRLEAARAEPGVDAELSFVGSSSVGRGLHEPSARVGCGGAAAASRHGGRCAAVSRHHASLGREAVRERRALVLRGGAGPTTTSPVRSCWNRSTRPALECSSAAAATTTGSRSEWRSGSSFALSTSRCSASSCSTSHDGPSTPPPIGANCAFRR